MSERKFVDVTPIIEDFKIRGAELNGCDPVVYGIHKGFAEAAKLLSKAQDCNDNPAIHARYARWTSKGGSYRCSHCWAKALWSKEGSTGGYSHEFTPIPSKFCPNCGAEMEAETP